LLSLQVCGVHGTGTILPLHPLSSYYWMMEDKTASQQIDDIISLYGGWKAGFISQIRAIIKAADPEVVEAVKWRMKTRPEGLPVWSHDGIICILETFKNDQKLVFFKGAQLKDPSGLLNARLNSKTDRAIELHEGDTIDEAKLGALITEAVNLNGAKNGK